jgi:signal transduction histidine kinase
METALLLTTGILIVIVIALQIRSNRKFKGQARMMMIQGLEIKKQLQALQVQNQLLEELNIEKQLIIGVVSHDLKGPFNRIFALVHLISLSGENFTEEQKEYLGKIHQIVADGLGMVRNLLDNRKFEDKGIDLLPEKLDISAVVSSMVKNYSVLSEKKKIQIHLTAPQQLVLTTDKMCLTRIMDNLLSNALKFSPPETNVYVIVREISEFIEIMVKDEGPGIPLSDQQKLFQKYQPLTPRPTGGESSTGLGLYLIQTMISKMGGEVFYETEENKGATFVIRLRKSEQVIPTLAESAGAIS